MINPERLRMGPGEPEAPPPILSDEQVRSILIEQHEAARSLTHQTSGFLESSFDSRKAFDVFNMSAKHELSPVFKKGRGKVGLCERARFQTIAFEVMSSYGLDTSVFKPKYTTGGFDSSGTSRNNDGTSREFLVYPSQTIPGMSFERWRDYYTDTGETIFVGWSVEGHKQPFRKHFDRLIPRGPQVVEI